MVSLISVAHGDDGNQSEEPLLPQQQRGINYRCSAGEAGLPEGAFCPTLLLNLRDIPILFHHGKGAGSVQPPVVYLLHVSGRGLLVLRTSSFSQNNIVCGAKNELYLIIEKKLEQVSSSFPLQIFHLQLSGLWQFLRMVRCTQTT